MTRKELYDLAARAMRKAGEASTWDSGASEHQLCAEALADEFASIHSGFDRARFLADCSAATPRHTYQAFLECGRLLVEHAQKLGRDKAVACLIAHGANASCPNLTTVPECQLKRLSAKLRADLRELP